MVIMRRETLLEKGFSEEQVSDLLDLFHKENNAQANANLQSEVDRLKEFETKYNNVQKQLDDINKAKMTAEEQIEADRKAAEENLKKSQIILNTATAKDILAGYNVDDDLISSLVQGDEQTTIAKANLLKSKFEALEESATKKAREELSNLNAKPNPSNVPQGDDVMTKEKFDTLSMTEQKAWKDANIDKYREFYPQK